MNIISNITLPINNTVTYSSTKVATIPVLKNSFLDINMSALTGPNSNINIIREGLNPLILSGDLKKRFYLGSDVSNRTSFTKNTIITIIFNVNLNETITINKLNYNVNVPINFKIVLIIFLIVYFLLDLNFNKR